MKELKELKYELNTQVGSVLRTRSSILTSMISKDAENYDNTFDFLKSQMETEKSKIGSLCKRYIECASKNGKLDKARAEIHRMLDMAATKSGKLDCDVDRAATCILEKYAPVPEHDDKLPNQNVGAILMEIQHMRHLLDIMERNIQGKLTEQEAAEMEKNRTGWMMDIEKLRQMVAALGN